jgi:CAAX protease family protein
VSVYLATFLTIGYATHLAYVAAIVGAAAATAFTNLVIDRGRWRIGLFVPLRFAIRELALGALFAAVLIGLSDLLVLATTSLRHTRGSGFPWPELLVVYIPAAVHEELVFRGYLFQKMRAWNRRFAVVFSAIVFGTLHTINQGVTPIAVINIIVAGVLLALGYELFERLWFPIGLHLAWNLATGPILGYSVSGFTGESTLLVTAGKGPPWLTGGAFGLEGSLWIGVVELAAVAALLSVRRRKADSLAAC